MWFIRSIIPLFVGLSFWISHAQAGSITGHVVVTEALSKKRVTLPSYQLRTMALPLVPRESKLLGELDRLIIFLEGNNLQPPSPIQVELDQKDSRFSSEILVIPVGSSVSFPNSDPIFHNVFSLSKPKQFDLGYYPAGKTRIVKFNRVGAVQVYCHLHAQMNAAILVVPTEWYLKPQEDGTFRFKEIPQGHYNIVAWHKSAGFFRKGVDVSAQGNLSVDFQIPVRVQE